MSRFFFLFAVLFLLFSCSGKQRIPSGILPPEKMKNVLWDVLEAQSLTNELAAHDTSINKQASLDWLTNEALKINHTDSVNYNRSYNWYAAHPEIMKVFLDSLYEQKQREKDIKLPRVHKPSAFK